MNARIDDDEHGRGFLFNENSGRDSVQSIGVGLEERGWSAVAANNSARARVLVQNARMPFVRSMESWHSASSSSTMNSTRIGRSAGSSTKRCYSMPRCLPKPAVVQNAEPP
jgi:hypothetical protein